MASSYDNNLRLEEQASGENATTWGDKTNTNLELIAEAFSYGTRAIANASTDTITIADGTSDADRSLYLKLTGGGQACTVTLAPDSISKVWVMENATSFTLTFNQGTGGSVANGRAVAVPAGDVKVIATDGAEGSAAVVHEVFTDLSTSTKLTIKNPATSSSPATLLLQSGDTDVAADDVLGKIQFQAPDEGTGTDAILVAAEVAAVSEGDFSSSSNATKLSFKTGASEAASEKMALSSAGSLSLMKDSQAINFGVNSDVTLTHVHDSGLTMAVTGNNDATLQINADVADATVAPFLVLNRTSDSPADDDLGGQIKFDMENDNNQQFTAAAVHSKTTDVSDGTEDGQLLLQTMVAGTLATNMTIGETSVSFKVDGTAVGNQGFAQNTTMLFYQSSAPTGWTKSTANNNKALRVVSGSGGSAGGSVAFTTAFASKSVSGTVGSTTLALSQIPSHNHNVRGPMVASGSAQYSAGNTSGTATASAGGGGSHNHSFSGTAINLAVQYCDVIICTKDA